jgi:hypothetical protein
MLEQWIVAAGFSMKILRYVQPMIILLQVALPRQGTNAFFKCQNKRIDYRF